jgi:hypothetical protein
MSRGSMKRVEKAAARYAVLWEGVLGDAAVGEGRSTLVVSVG